MNTRFVAYFILVTLLPATARAQDADTRNPTTGSDPQITECTVAAAKDLRISAPETGPLISLLVDEGSRVKADEDLGRVDDREAQMQREIAKNEMAKAKQQALDDIDIRYSKKAHAVAEQKLEVMLEANRQATDAFPLVEVEEARLDAQRARLAIEKATSDRKLARNDYWIAETKHEAAGVAIERRVIRAPSAGEVVKLFREEGEWVNAGDPILRLMRLDLLHVEGKLNVEQYDPAEVAGCKVTVRIAGAGGRQIEVPGKIVWINPVAEWEGHTVQAVRAEITNPPRGSDWLISPGLEATMTIHLGSAVATREARVRTNDK